MGWFGKKEFGSLKTNDYQDLLKRVEKGWIHWSTAYDLIKGWVGGSVCTNLSKAKAIRENNQSEMKNALRNIDDWKKRINIQEDY